MFGLGGIFVEVMKDVTFHLAPITAGRGHADAEGDPVLRAAQGRARRRRRSTLDAIAAALQRISQLTTDFPQIAELDINPFIVGEVGIEADVADARMTLDESHAAATMSTEPKTMPSVTTRTGRRPVQVD